MKSDYMKDAENMGNSLNYTIPVKFKITIEPLSYTWCFQSFAILVDDDIVKKKGQHISELYGVALEKGSKVLCKVKDENEEIGEWFKNGCRW